MRRHSRKNQRGFVAIAYAAMLVTMVGFTGLAVDVGYMQFEKRKIQMAADAGAMGALREMERGNTDIINAGQTDASLNGFTDNGADTIVSVANPPGSGPYANDLKAVQVTVTHKVPFFFMQIFGQNQGSLSATSTARTSTNEGSIGGCIFAMDPHADGSLNVSGNLTITTACSAVVNSDSSIAFEMGGNSTWNLINGAAIGVYGGSNLYGSEVLNETTQGELAIQQLTAPVADPLAGVSAPTSSGMTVMFDSKKGFADTPTSTTALSPGIYCGGMDLKGTVTFSPGIYVLAGGGMQIESSAVVTNSTTTTPGAENGVMFYNTYGNGWGCQGGGQNSAGPFWFDGNSTINLAGLSTTTPVGVLFFDDRSTSGLSHKILGNSTSTFDGALYFLPNTVTFQGTNKTPGFLYIVADMIDLTGNASLNINTVNVGNDHSALVHVKTFAPSATGGGLVQ